MDSLGESAFMRLVQSLASGCCYCGSQDHNTTSCPWRHTMNEEIKPVPPAVGEYAIEDRKRLLDRIAGLEEALELADRGVANCEVFRQRLAKYEDADGRPVAAGDCAPMITDLRALSESQCWASEPLLSASAALESPAAEQLYAALYSACGESCSATDAAMGACMDFMRTTIEKHEKAREFWADLSVHLAQNGPYAGRIPDYVERLATRRHPMIVEAQAVAVAETAALYRQQLADQAREIERLKRSAQTNWNEFADTVKAQPSGVVLPEPMKRGDEGGSGEYGAAMIRGYNACLREVARLKSSAVSAGATVKQSLTVGGVDERAAFEAAWCNRYKVTLPEFHPSQHRLGDGYNPEYSPFISTAWWAWQQARAALTAPAPSHSEQVREGWKAGFKLHEVHKALDCGLPHPSYWAETCDGEPHVHTKLWRGLPGCGSFHSSRFWPLYGVSMLAAAPSAGNQQGGGTL